MRRALLIDAMGTVVWMHPPWKRIEPELVRGLPEATVRAAFEAEIAHYRAAMMQGSDRASLELLRRECAEILSHELGRTVTASQMMRALQFEVYPDALPALARAREAGAAIACVSNWDCSLPDVLEAAGLGDAFDVIVSSARAGYAKPDPAIFETALADLGVEAGAAIHVGDSPEEDIAGARSAGIEALLIDRSGGGDISSLDQIHQHLGS